MFYIVPGCHLLFFYIYIISFLTALLISVIVLHAVVSEQKQFIQKSDSCLPLFSVGLISCFLGTFRCFSQRLLKDSSDNFRISELHIVIFCFYPLAMKILEDYVIEL